jgi:UPF0755 protein
VLLLLIAGCSMLADHYGAPRDPLDRTDRVVVVPAGATARSMGAPLEAAGAVESADDFVTYVKLSKEGSCIKAGRHKVQAAMSAAEIIAALCGVPLPEDQPFTIKEGWRIREIDAALAEKGWTQPGEYAALVAGPDGYTASYPLPAHSLEGYLYPDTYMVNPDKWDTRAFVQRQLDLFAERFYAPNEAKIKASSRSLDQLVIMSSMIEKEEPTPAQRPTIAGILWKRLDAGWNLGVDATSRYTLEDWNDRKPFLRQLRDPSDVYNTRLRPGLPPTGIGNPGITALEAALNPVESDWWYYLHDEQKVLHPARDEAEHEANRRKYNVY